MKFRVTASLLRKMGACEGQAGCFERDYPQGMLYGLRGLNRAARDGFSTEWFLGSLLSVRAYHRAQAAGSKICSARAEGACPTDDEACIRCCNRRLRIIHRAATKEPISRWARKLIKETT